MAFDYRRGADGLRDEAALAGFVQHVAEHGYGVLHLFSDDTITRMNASLDTALLESCGAVFGDIIGDDEALRNASLKRLGGVRKRGAASHIFYADAIMATHISATMQHVFDTLYAATWAARSPLYPSPEPFTGSVPYLDRFGLRLPSWVPPCADSAGPEEGLGLHMDMDPYNPYLLDAAGESHLVKWRPFQSFVTVSDHSMAENGGLCVVPDFHRRFEQFFATYARGLKVVEEHGLSHSGEFFRMGEVDGSEGMHCVPVLAPAGALVLWDSRLPHKTTKTCGNPLGRKVMFGSWLPGTGLNRAYAERQRDHFRRGILPPSEHDVSACYKSPRLRLNAFQATFF